MIEHEFEPTGYYAEDGFVPPSARDRTRAMKEAAEMVAKHTPWWVVKRDTGTVEVHKQHRGPASDFCIAEINQWDDNAKKTATRIVHCVNLHDELVAVLELLLKWQNPIIAEHVSCVENAKALLARTREAK